MEGRGIILYLLAVISGIFAGTRTANIQEFNPVGIQHASIVHYRYISTSSNGHGIHSYNGRLHYHSYWAPADSDNAGWLQILPTNVWTYHQVATQGANTNPVKVVKQYQLAFYIEGNWIKYTENGAVKDFTGNADISTVVTHNLTNPQTALGIRFYPTCCRDQQNYGLRVEAYGVLSDISYGDVGTVYNGYIHQYAFTASSGTTTYARVGQGSSAWHPTNPVDSWLAIDLGTVHLLQGYKIEGHTTSSYVKVFQLWTSPQLNGSSWECIEKNGQCQNFTSSSHYASFGVFPTMHETRHMKITPLEWSTYMKLRIGFYGRKKDMYPAISLSNSAYSTSSNHQLKTHGGSAYLVPRYAGIAWVATSTSDNEWFQVTFSTYYDIATIKYRGKYSGKSYGAKYFKLLVGSDQNNLACVKEPGSSDCKVYYNAANGAVASENALLDGANFVTTKYVRLQQITPILSSNPHLTAVVAFTGFMVPQTCTEAQLRYGFPPSGWYWLDLDGTGTNYAPTRVQCDMSTIPPAILLSHNKENVWMHSKDSRTHINHTDTVTYNIEANQVDKIVDNSVSCEMPFEAHGRGVSLRSANWHRDSTDLWLATSFRNLEDDVGFEELQVSATTGVIPDLAGMWVVEPPDAVKPGRNGLPKSAIEIGHELRPNYTLAGGNETLGSFTILLILQLYDDQYTSGASIFTSANSGQGQLRVTHGPTISQISVSLTAIDGSTTSWSLATPLHSIPRRKWFSLAVSYNETSGEMAVHRDCRLLKSEMAQANRQPGISLTKYLGKAASDTAQVHMDISDVILHSHSALTEETCNDWLSIIDDSQSFGNVEKIKDCRDLVGVAGKSSGVYKVHPYRMPEGVFVYCDLDTDGGGWTRILRRSSADLSFDHLWNEYREGFGSVDGDHFLGLENIHRLTTSHLYELRFDLTDYSNTVEFILYDHIMLLNDEQDYAVYVGNKIDGDADDALHRSGGNWNKYAKFNTKDRGSRRQCLGGNGWSAFGNFADSCLQANLFSKYVSGSEGCEITKRCTPYDHLCWGYAKRQAPSKIVDMKLRRIGDPDSHALLTSLSLPMRSFVGDSFSDYHNAPYLATKNVRPMACTTIPVTTCSYAAYRSGSKVPSGVWLQLDLGQRYMVTSLATQCRYFSSQQCWSTFDLYFSLNGVDYQCYGTGGACETLTTGHGAQAGTLYEIKVMNLKPVQVRPSRFLRFIPKTYKNYPSTRMEIFVKNPTKTDMPIQCESGVDGLRTIYPHDFNSSLNVYCESEWAIVLRRTGSAGGFKLATMQTYIDGHNLNNMATDFWLGLESLHLLTKSAPQRMRVELTDGSGLTKVVDYDAVRILSRQHNYALRGISGPRRIPIGDGRIAAVYLGCWRDASDRAMQGGFTADENNTIEFCGLFCHQKGFSYYGLQYYTHCFCGTEYNKYGQAQEKDCDKPCGGNSDQMCGGEYRNSVYKIVQGANVTLEDVHLGCWRDSTVKAMTGHSLVVGANTIETCISECVRKDFVYAGLESGTSCFCGDSYNLHGQIADAECNTSCPGDSSQKCGGTAALSVYSAEIYAGNSLLLTNQGFTERCGAYWWYPPDSSCPPTNLLGYLRNLTWETFNFLSANHTILKKAVIKMKPSAARYAGANLPSYAYSGTYSSDSKCHAVNAPLYLDGLLGDKAWCAPEAAVSSQYYLQVDLKNHFYIKTVLTRGLKTGRVTSFKLHLSESGYTYVCYAHPQSADSCDTMFAVTSEDLDFLSSHDLIHTRPVRYVRVEPMSYITYPKLTVEFMLTLDRTHGDTWKGKRFDMYGGLIDSVTKRAHPVNKLHLGATGNPFSVLEYRLPGPLRCYNAYKTCGEVKAAGLPPGVYRLDPDGVTGDTVPFPVDCFFDEQGPIMGSVYHQKKQMTAQNGVYESMHYGEGSLTSLKHSTEHLQELISLSRWHDQYMRYETGHTDSSESTWQWEWMGQGGTSGYYYRPNSEKSDYCLCGATSSCVDSDKACHTFGPSHPVDVDEGYLIGISASIKLPVTQWLPNTDGGKAFFGSLDMYFNDIYGDVYGTSATSYSYSQAVTECVKHGNELATFDQLYEANRNGYDSRCVYGWVREGMAYALFRPRLKSNGQFCIGTDATRGVRMRTEGSTFTGKAFCYTGGVQKFKPVSTGGTISPVTKTYSDYVFVDYCAAEPCRSQGTCVNDRLHQYFCFCLASNDKSEHCTQGLRSCADYQTRYKGSSGYYYIDPDGVDVGEAPFEAYCDMSRVPPLTVLENKAACGVTYRGVSGKGHAHSLSVDVGYRVPVTNLQLRNLIRSSSFCHQVVNMATYNSGISNVKYKIGTTSLTERTYSYLVCDCYPNCNPSNSKCNAYSKVAAYKTDSITITDRGAMPVRVFYIGDVDLQTELFHVKVSNLECITDKLLPSCSHYYAAGYRRSGQYTMDNGWTTHCDMSQGLTDPTCPPNYTRRPGTFSCYYVYAAAANQQFGTEKCILNGGGRMAALNSAEEAAFVRTLTTDHWEYRVGMMYMGDNVVTGRFATQLSRYNRQYSKLAIDENVNTYQQSDTEEGFYWFKIELHFPMNVTSVKLHNRLHNQQHRTVNFYFLSSLTGKSSPGPESAEWDTLVYNPGLLGSSKEWMIKEGAGVMASYIGLYFADVVGYTNFAEILIGVGDRNKDIYKWLDGTSQLDYVNWQAGYPTSSRKKCVTWSYQHKMKDHSCESVDRAVICELTLPNVTKEMIYEEMKNLSSPTLGSLDQSTRQSMEECHGVGPCASSPCLNNGTCAENFYTESYTCTCIDAFLGDRCEISRLCPFEPLPAYVNITLVLGTGDLHLIENVTTLIDDIPVTDYNFTVGSYFQYECLTGTLLQGSAKRTCSNNLQWSGSPPVCGELSSCIDYQIRCHPSGSYELDFDGVQGPLAPVKAYCDMSTVPPTTIVHTTNPWQNKVQGFSSGKSYSMEVEYDVADGVIESLIQSSVTCTQELQYACYKNMLYRNYAWIGKDNSTQHTYLDSDSRYCSCYNKRACTNRHHGCNCDYNDYRWRKDIGYIKDKDKLPIKRVFYGGQSTDRSLGFHQVGPLRCQQAYATCADYKSAGYTGTHAWIDSDGLGGTPAVYVKCDYNSDTVTFTHNYPWRQPFTGYGYSYYYRDPFSWTRAFTYAPNNPTDINAFLATAKSVSQTITYVCLNSFLYYDGVQYGGWAGPDGQIQESFAGTPENGQGCACGNSGTCSYGVKCTCSDVWYNWRFLQDQSTVTRPELLPITAVYMGRLAYDHGSYHRYGLMFLDYLTAQVNNDASTPRGEDCSADASICTDGLTCQSGTKKCGCDTVNDPNSILHPNLGARSGSNPCETSTPCLRSGVCHWDPWAEDRFYCECVGVYGGPRCNIHGAVNGGWSLWSQWGPCEGICDNGTQIKNKTCNNPPASHGGSTCGGSDIESQICDTNSPCPIDGQWSSWHEWTACSASCGQGTRQRNLTCDNPAPQHGGNDCVGNVTMQSEMCTSPNQCPINGNWSNWGNWSSCSVSCDNGTLTRIRKCDNPLPKFNGTDCTGNETETLPCFLVDCPVDGGWTHWTNWTDCTVTCENGTQSRNRSCTNPVPKFNGNDCHDMNKTIDYKICHNTVMCPVNGGWSNWTEWSNCSASCDNGTVTRNRSCDSPIPMYNGTDCSGPTNEAKRCLLMHCPINGNWTLWTPWTACSVTCENGTQTRNRSCTDPEPQYGGDNCTEMNFTTAVRMCYGGVMCPVNGSWSNWTEWTNCSDSCGHDCIIPCGNGTMQRYRNCTTALYDGYDCLGESMENITCALPIACKKKFTVPPGAYVRNADYYWSFNEWADSGALEIFQNTGEYSFGLFNASTSFIEQKNDSIHNGSTWYTVKFSKLKKQCITIPGFENVNHSCLVDPTKCSNGLSMEVWLKFQKTDFDSKESQTILASGNTRDAGHGGIYVSQLGRQISVLVANGSVVWLAEKALPNNIKPDEWFNLAFRWNAVKGIQVFINGMLIEEIPFSTPKKTAYLPADNKLYVGCRKHELVLKDFTNVELDELAFWRRYLFDSELKYFTGSIIDEEEIVDTVFDYKEDIVELLPPPLPYQNPYYRVADVYEPCDNENVNFGNDALVNITRGGGEGVLLPQITGTDVTIPGTQSANVGDLDAAKKLSVSFWLLPDVDDSATAVILKGSNWHISVDEGNITVSARYTTSTMVNETRQTFIVEEVVSVGIITGIWTNVAFSWNNEAGVQLYVNGKSKASEAYVTKTNKNSQLGNADKLVVMKTTENITISDIVIWKRDLYPFEVYRFLGMSPSEAYLDTHADLYWSTDYYVVRDKASTNTLLPLYKTVNSTVKTASKAGMAGHSNKGEAMEVSDTNGWVMLGMTNTGGKFTPETGEEFAGTCLSDPSLCGDGVTVALWLKIYEVPKTRQTISIMTSGEEDSLSRGFSITMQEKHLNITLVDGKYYWKVSMLDGKYPVDDWMHLAFSWKADEGLWVFMNGELVAANKDGVPHIRTHDRYSRITLGRNNANNAFGGFMSFAFQEIAVYFKFTVTYRIREIFALIDNAYYEKADKYFNKDMLITGTIENLKYAKDRNLYIGPIGTVDAKNNTISLGEGATLTLEYLTSQDCIANPAHCAEGITVSTWTRNNLLLGNEHPPVFLLSSHQKPEEVRAGRLAGWTIYYIGNTFMVSLVSETTMFNITISEMAKPLLPQRWTNIGFTWSKLAGMTVFLDGQVAGIMKYGHSVSPTAMNLATPSLAAGHTSNDNKTFIDIYNVAIWQRYYFGSKAYQLTGHREDVILKYSAADLMWPFDGPVHMLNTKFSEMLIRKETYDSSLKGAALQVTRDGRTNASLGNYSSECLTQPSSCTSGFQLGMQLKLANYVPGNEGDKFGSILLLGSPDANFEGVAIQMVNEAGVDKISVLVANDRYIWRETIEAITNAWFDLVIGWNINDGIAMKVNNKRKYGTEIRTFLEYGSSKLITNKLILGVGSGGGTNQGVDAQYNDVTVTYNGNVNEEQEGRCYDSAALDYRLNKGQILTMENVLYTRDRQDFKVSAFNLDGDGYVELDQFAGRCYSDPGLCADGLSLSAYLRVYAVGNSSETLLGTGFPTTQGYQMQVTKAPVEDDKAIMTVSLNDGERTWQVQTELALKVWVNIGFAWNATKGTGLALFVDGALKVTDDDPRLENKPEKRSRTTLVIGRGNDNADTDFSHCVFDDIGIWDKDVRAGTADSTIAGTILKGQACQDEGLVVKTEVAIPVAPTTMNISGATDRPVGCRFYDPETGLCSANSLDFFAKAANNSGLTINNLGMALKEYKQDTAKFTVNTTNPKVVVENFVQTIGSISTMPMKKNIDPTEVEETLTSILTITGHLFNGDTWKNQWQDVESNSSTGAASVISDIDDIALKFTQNMAVGLDKADDCSAAKAACSSIIMSGEKRRLALCDRPYTYPQYEVLSTDKAINDTLHLWKMPSDKFVIPFNAWKRDEHPDDTIVVVAMVLYNAADSVLPTRVDLPTFINLDATTSADNPVSAKDKAVVLQVKLNSRVMSITVSPPLKPPLEECVEITLEHTVRNEGNKRTAYCTFFDHKVKNMQGGAWSSKGCDMTSTNESHTVCCCYHLTSFAVMMEPLVEEPVDTMSQKISYMIYACTGLSLLSLLIFCLIIICSKSLRNERSMVHLNLSIAMIFATTSYLLVDFVKEIPVYCQAVAIAQHYFFMVAYAWILMEALCLFYAVLYGELIGRMKCYAPIAWRKFE